METTRVALTTGVGQLTGEGEVIEPMGDEPAMDADMEPTVDAEAPAEDDFAAAEAAMLAKTKQVEQNVSQLIYHAD